MRVAWAILVAAACGSEPTLIGKLCSDDRPCPNGLFCDRSKVCVLELEATEKLSLIAEGPGSGIVTSAPAGLRCEESCDVDFATGITVTLTAHAMPGSGFAGWRGACTGSGPCVVSMSDARSVTAVFGLEIDHPWVVRYGGSGDDRITAVGVDFAGNPIVAGSFSTMVQIGSEKLTSRGGSDGFVAKLDSSSQVSWLATYGGTSEDVPLAIATSIDQKILVGGWYFGPSDLFGESHPGAGAADPLLARLDPGGTRELALDLGSGANDTSESIVFDDRGGAWVAGWVAGPLTAGGITRGHVGRADAYLVHYDAGGAADFVEVFGGPGDDKALSVDRSPRGDRVALVGSFQDAITVGGTSITSTVGYGLFVAVFDAAGEPIWSKGFAAGTAGEPFANGRFDREGNLVLAGGFHDFVDLGDGPRASAGDLDAFVARFSREGDLFWAKTFGGTSADAFFDLRVDAYGHAVLGGGFNEMVEFGADPLTSAGSWDAALVKLDTDGEHVWSRRFGGRDVDVILGVGLDVAGTAIAGGHFGGTVDFGATLLTSEGSQDAFLMAVGR